MSSPLDKGKPEDAQAVWAWQRKDASAMNEERDLRNAARLLLKDDNLLRLATTSQAWYDDLRAKLYSVEVELNGETAADHA